MLLTAEPTKRGGRGMRQGSGLQASTVFRSVLQWPVLGRACTHFTIMPTTPYSVTPAASQTMGPECKASELATTGLAALVPCPPSILLHTIRSPRFSTKWLLSIDSSDRPVGRRSGQVWVEHSKVSRVWTGRETRRGYSWKQGYSHSNSKCDEGPVAGK